jgi:RNA polymerase sigma factor (sigma-70 family)
VADLQRTLALAESHLSMDIRRAVAQLTARQQQALLLVYIIGMTEEETASALGVRQQTVNESLKSSIQKLQKMFLVDVPVKKDSHVTY